MGPMFAVTVAAVAVAAIMSLVAWRVVREERRRADARIAALAADIQGASRSLAGDLPLRHPSFAAVAVDATRERRQPALASYVWAAVLLVGGIAAMLILLKSGADPVSSGRVSAAGAPSPRPPSTVAAQAVTLDLLALSDERDDDRLVVRGIVRNPGRVRVNRLSAVVLLFNADGRFLTSGRVQMNSLGLGPGIETPFVVSVPGAADVARYRVSFRSDDRVVPHVDRRTQ